METTVTGPATLSFDWSVSSELDYDFLTFYLDGVSQFAISGEVAFETKSVAIPAGSHTLRWEYSKDSSASNGADTGWVDNITLCAGVVTIDTTDISAPFAGSNGNAINITTACNWSAVSNVPWIIFNSSTSGTGNGSVNFDILPTADLVGSIDIGGNKVIVRRSGSDGGLDATFTPNPSTFNFGDGTAIDYQSVVRQPDGKLVVAGNADSNGSLATDDIILRRYNSDGSIDTSFGVNGTFIWDSGGGWDYAFSVALQADGKIIVAGKSDTGPLNGMVLLRLNSDGTLDTGFNALGYAVFKPTANIPVARRVRVQPDGKITVGGWLWSASNMDGLLVRFNSDGTLDTSFNGSGYTLFNSPSNYHDSFKDFTLMPDGRIVVSGLSHNGTSFESLVARYNSDGTFDTSFNTTGYKIFNTSIDNHYGETLALQNDGSIYSAGAISGTNSGNRNIGYLAHILADGTLDTAFGTAGLAQYLYGATGNTNFTEITLQADGKIIVAGNRSPAAGNGDAVVMRFDAAGVLDASFGDGGVTALNIPGSGGGDITSILLQPDGKLIAIGNDYAAVNTNGFIIRQTLFNPVNGACGSSNGITLTSIPTANFCSAGAATSVTGSGHPWSWSCTGSNGGTDAACSATIQTHTVSFAAAANGTITGTASQGIDHGGSTTSVTATANSGYTFSNWTGTGGFATTTSNPLTLSNVTAAMTITANFTANPVNGACGSSNGITLTSIPTANFCSAGTATSVTGSGHPWSWSCTGLNGGTDDACSATIQETKTDGILIPAPNKVEPTIEDALRSLKITVGEITPTADDIRHGDIAPIVNGIPQPDGKVNLGDTIVILRRTIGLTSW